MAGPKINGTLAPILQAPEIEYDPVHGQTIRFRYLSAGDGLMGISAGLVAGRIAHSVRRSGLISEISAQASGAQLGFPEVSTDDWQVTANEIQVDIKQHPDVLAMEAAYPGTIGYIVRDVELYNAGEAPGDPAPNAGAMPTSGRLFAHLIRGVTHMAKSQYVLKHTTSVGNGYAANISDVNIERNYTTAQLLAEVTNPALWVFPMPGRLQFKLQAIFAPSSVTGYQWGWRKLASSETTSASNHVSINTEYWLEQWSNWLYPPVT